MNRSATGRLFECTYYAGARCAPVYLAILLLILLFGGGCRKEPNLPTTHQAPATKDVASFAEQLASVQAGRSDEIRLEHEVLGAEQLAKLRGLEALRALVLDAGIASDGDVANLNGLSHLEHLRLRESALTDDGLRQLADSGLDSLTILNLPQARPTAVGLSHLARFPKLRSLRIAGRQIDDAAIVELSTWPALSSLHLIQPGITDAALETLASMPELSSLYIDDCRLSDAAWEKLFAARPKLHVHVDQAHHDLDPHAKH